MSSTNLIEIATYIDERTRKKMLKKRGSRGIITNSAYLRDLIHKDIEAE